MNAKLSTQFIIKSQSDREQSSVGPRVKLSGKKFESILYNTFSSNAALNIFYAKAF